MLGLDRLRSMARVQGESDLSLVHCAQMIFQTSEAPICEKESVAILGKASSPCER